MKRHKQRIDKIERALQPVQPVRYVWYWSDEEPPVHEDGEEVRTIRLKWLDEDEDSA